MPRRTYLVLFLISLISAPFVVGFGPVASPPVQTGTCAREYVVRWGDTLSGIARRYQTTVPVLVQLNHIANPNWIFSGETLCLPPLPTEPERGSQIVIEATYSFTPNAEEATWPLAELGSVGKRAIYPLSTLDSFDTVGTAEELFAHVQLSDGQATLLWLSPGLASTGYALVSVGEGEPLAALRVIDTESDTPFVPPPGMLDCPSEPIQVLAEPGLTTSAVTLWLESPEGLRYPFTITEIAHADNLDQIEACFQQNATLAVQRSNSDPDKGYKAVMVLYDEVDGPPGGWWRQRCSSWAGGGAFYRWLRSFYNCY